MRSPNLTLPLQMAAAGLLAAFLHGTACAQSTGDRAYQEPGAAPPPPPNVQPPPSYQAPPAPYAPPPQYYQAPPPGYAPPPPNYQPPPPNYQPQAAGEPATWAVWTPKELRFVFMGFTAKYSCDGLQARMKGVLLQLGARPDLQVRQGPCGASLGTPTVFPTVTIKMSVLQPVTASTDTRAQPPVVARWKRVDLTSAPDAVKQAGDCEIIEQIEQRILPQFTTRNVDYKSTCIPNQLTLGGTHLSTDVLVAEPPPPGSHTAAAR